MHVDALAITLLPAHDSRHNDQLVLGDVVPDASLGRAGSGDEVEFQGGGELHHEEEEREDGPHCEWRGTHCLGSWTVGTVDRGAVDATW